MGARKIKLLLAYYLFTFALVGCMTLESDALAQSLLKGATPSSFSAPAGWKVYATQNFESGLNAGPNEFLIYGAITTANPHSGSHSAQSNDGRNHMGWGFDFFPGGEVYVSWWLYADSTIRFNEEWWLFARNTQSGPFCELILDFYNSLSGQYNSPTPDPVIVMQGCVDRPIYHSDFTFPSGAWHQWEVWYRPNTPNLSDGFVKTYLDGVAFPSFTATNQNFNGGINMAGSRLILGGVYTKNIWNTSPGVCSLAIGSGVEVGHCSDFSNCACPPNPPIFNAYFDDIIVLVPSGTADATPPNPPTSLTVK